jgi:hypothetical protein
VKNRKTALLFVVTALVLATASVILWVIPDQKDDPDPPDQVTKFVWSSPLAFWAGSGALVGAAAVGTAWLLASRRRRRGQTNTAVAAHLPAPAPAAPTSSEDLARTVVAPIAASLERLVQIAERALAQRQPARVQPLERERSYTPDTAATGSDSWQGPAFQPPRSHSPSRLYAELRSIGGSAQAPGMLLFVEVQDQRVGYLIEEHSTGRGSLRPNERSEGYDPSWQAVFGLGSDGWKQNLAVVSPKRVLRRADNLWQLER